MPCGRGWRRSGEEWGMDGEEEERGIAGKSMRESDGGKRSG